MTVNNDNRFFISQLDQYKSFEKFASSDLITASHLSSLHAETFIETLNNIIKFMNDAKYFTDNPTESKIAQVINATMGGGKSTALEVACKLTIVKEDMPLLLVFNKEKSMENVLNPVVEYANLHGIREAVKIINNKNIEQVKDDLYRYKIIGITQQRFRDIATGCGDYSILNSYRTKIGAWEQNQKRSIIFDEMPIMFDAEVFNIGPRDNCLDWFEEGIQQLLNSKQVSRQYSQKASIIINNIFALEMAEVANDDIKSIPTRSLRRHIEGSTQYQLLQDVLAQFDKIYLSHKSQRRYNWFKTLLNQDSMGVINRDDNSISVYCSKYIDYTRFGHVLVLDGTSDITKEIYEHGNFEFIPVENHHDYKDRLRMYFVDINTSKESRKDDYTHEKIAASLLEYKSIGSKSGLKVLALPNKSDVDIYRDIGVISDYEFKKFFSKIILDNEPASSISLLNVTGDNEINQYDGLALLSLPVRHPSFYKLASIALYGTGIDISLNQTNTNKESINWFNEEKSQKIYESLVLMDFSQIIHRMKIRNINDKTVSTFFVYSNKIGWGDKLQRHYKLPDSKCNYIRLLDETKFAIRVSKWVKVVEERFHDLDPKKRYTLGAVNSKLKDWFKDNWTEEKKQEIIIAEFGKAGFAIEIATNGYKYLRIG